MKAFFKLLLTATVVCGIIYGLQYMPVFPRGNSRGGVYMHEISHALALDHVENSHRLMNATVNQFNGELPEGDIEGLNILADKIC